MCKLPRDMFTKIYLIQFMIFRLCTFIDATTEYTLFLEVRDLITFFKGRTK